MPKNSKFFTRLIALSKKLVKDAETQGTNLLEDNENDPEKIAFIQPEIDKIGQTIVEAKDIINNCLKYKDSLEPISVLIDNHFLSSFQNLSELNKESDDFSVVIAKFIEDADDLTYQQEKLEESKYESDNDSDDNSHERTTEHKQEQKEAVRRHSSHHVLFGRADSLLITKNNAKITQLKNATDLFLRQSHNKFDELQIAIDSTNDNDVRFNKVFTSLIVENVIVQLDIIVKKCNKLLEQESIEGIEPLEFFKVDQDLKMALESLHSDFQSLINNVDPVGFLSLRSNRISDTAQELKTYLDKIATIIPGLPKASLSNDPSVASQAEPTPQYKSPFVILKLQADNFVKELMTLKVQVETEIAAINPKAEALLLNKQTKLNMLNNAISQGKSISTICDHINNNTNTVSELRSDIDKFENPLDDLHSCAKTINVALEKEPVSWLSAFSFKSTNPGISIENFISTIESTLSRTQKSLPVQRVEQSHEGNFSRPSAS
jgi:hypothetical protein